MGQKQKHARVERRGVVGLLSPKERDLETAGRDSSTETHRASEAVCVPCGSSCHSSLESLLGPVTLRVIALLVSLPGLEAGGLETFRSSMEASSCLM